MTYLQLVNKVLTRLREDTVGTVTESDYSALIGEFVNEAKDEVESAWNWATLREVVEVAITSNVTSYDLGIETSAVLLRDSQDRRKVMAFCTNAGFAQQLFILPADYVSKQRILNEDSVTSTVPNHFSLEASGGNWVMQLLERPTDDLTYELYFKVPQAELEDEEDVITVPWRPVVAYAVMLALNERGEEMGEPGNIAERRYDKALGNAISLEAVQSNEQLVATPE